jgi:hypothetical protein
MPAPITGAATAQSLPIEPVDLQPGPASPRLTPQPNNGGEPSVNFRQNVRFEAGDLNGSATLQRREPRGEEGSGAELRSIELSAPLLRFGDAQFSGSVNGTLLLEPGGTTPGASARVVVGDPKGDTNLSLRGTVSQPLPFDQDPGALRHGVGVDLKLGGVTLGAERQWRGADDRSDAQQTTRLSVGGTLGVTELRAAGSETVQSGATVDRNLTFSVGGQTEQGFLRIGEQPDRGVYGLLGIYFER